MAKQSRVQGEGDYEAARRFRKRSEDFVATHDVEKAAHDAAPTSSREAEELAAAEAAGKKRAKGEEPALRPRSALKVEPTGEKGSRN